MPFNPDHIDVQATMQIKPHEFEQLIDNYKDLITQAPTNIKYLDTIRTLQYLYAYAHLSNLTHQLILARRKREKEYGSLTPIERISIFISMISAAYDKQIDILPKSLQKELKQILLAINHKPLNVHQQNQMSHSMQALICMRHYVFNHNITVRTFDPQVQRIENHLVHKLNRWYYKYTKPTKELNDIIQQVKIGTKIAAK